METTYFKAVYNIATGKLEIKELNFNCNAGYGYDQGDNYTWCIDPVEVNAENTALLMAKNVLDAQLNKLNERGVI